MTLWTTYVIFLHSAHIWLSSQCKLKWRILSRDINKSRAWHLTLLKRLFAGKQWMIFVCLSHNFCDSICFVLTLKYCLCLDTHLQQIIQPHCFDWLLILIFHFILFRMKRSHRRPQHQPESGCHVPKKPGSKVRSYWNRLVWALIRVVKHVRVDEAEDVLNRQSQSHRQHQNEKQQQPPHLVVVVKRRKWKKMIKPMVQITLKKRVNPMKRRLIKRTLIELKDFVFKWHFHLFSERFINRKLKSNRRGCRFTG